MSHLYTEQLEYEDAGGNVFGVLPVDSLPIAGNVLDLQLCNYISKALSFEERNEILQNRKLCPVWTVGIEVSIEFATIVESVTSEIIEPRVDRQKRKTAAQIIGTTMIADKSTTVLGVVGSNFSGVAELPDVNLDEADLPGLLRFMGDLPLNPDKIVAITGDMKPHQIKKAEKLRAAQQEMFVGEVDDVMRALRRVILVHGDIPAGRPLIPTSKGWRSW